MNENWNPKSWSKFIQKLIVELDLNIVLTTIKNKNLEVELLTFRNMIFTKI